MDEAVLIDVAGLSFSYDGQADVLCGVSLRVRRGERIGLVGPNGAGKSSLFLCLTGVVRGYRGRIDIEGLSPADDRQLREIRRRVGLVFQSSDDQLFNPTVLEDVAFGPLSLGMPREQALRAATASLERVRIPPELYDRPPHRLSSGQKRRVALAGVLAMSPDVLLLDEPASDLDPRGRAELIELLAAVGGTQMIAGHDLEMIRQTCRRVIVLDAGRLAADGPTDAILSDEDLMTSHGLAVPHSLRCCHTHTAVPTCEPEDPAGTGRRHPDGRP